MITPLIEAINGNSQAQNSSKSTRDIHQYVSLGQQNKQIESLLALPLEITSNVHDEDYSRVGLSLTKQNLNDFTKQAYQQAPGSVNSESTYMSSQKHSDTSCSESAASACEASSLSLDGAENDLHIEVASPNATNRMKECPMPIRPDQVPVSQDRW